jgi:hypothetical protein
MTNIDALIHQPLNHNLFQESNKFTKILQTNRNTQKSIAPLADPNRDAD